MRAEEEVAPYLVDIQSNERKVKRKLLWYQLVLLYSPTQKYLRDDTRYASEHLHLLEIFKFL